MKTHCPVCASQVEADLRHPPDYLFCENCEAHFRPGNVLISYSAALALAEERLGCTCDRFHGCPQCFHRADELVGATVRDSQGHTWEVTEVDEENGFPMIAGDVYWARPSEVEVLIPASAQPQLVG